MRLFLVGVLLVQVCYGTAGAQPLSIPQVHRVELIGDRPGLPHCRGLAFCPDGTRLAVFWDGPPEQLPPRQPDTPGRAAITQTTLSILGRPDGEAEQYPVSVVPFGPGTDGRNQLVVDRTGALLLVDAPKNLIRRTSGGKPGDRLGPPTLLSPATPLLTGTRLWTTDTPGTLFIASHSDKGAYELRRLESGIAPNENRLGVRSILHGGDRNQQLVGADLHRSGRWFVASHVSDPDFKPHLDLWELGDAPRKKEITLPELAHGTAFSPDGKRVVVGLADGRVGIYSVPALVPAVDPIQLGQFTVAAVAFHPAGQFLACGTFDRDGKDNLFIIHAVTGRVVARLPADPRGIGALCFNSTGTRLASFGSSGRVSVWDTSIVAGAPN